MLAGVLRSMSSIWLAYYLSTHGCSRVLSFSLTAAFLEEVPLEALAAAAAALALLLKKLAIFR